MTTISIVWHIVAIVIDVILISLSKNGYIKLLAITALACMIVSLFGELLIPVA